MFTIHAAHQSHPGLKRPNNEDFLAIYEPQDPAEEQANGRLYIVTDGVGGAAQGELASQYAAEKVMHEFYRSSQLHPGSRLRQTMRQVGNEIYHYAEETMGPVRMATTMVAAAIWEDSLTIANVGDSRAYLIRNKAAQQLTRDHNLASELVRDGVITEEEAQNSPVQSRITRSLGGELDVFVDVFPDIPLRPGDRLLLCSDGLTRYARPDDLVRMAVEGTPEEAVARMLKFANESGGADNVTVILVDIGAPLSPQDMPTMKIPRDRAGAQVPADLAGDTIRSKPLGSTTPARPAEDITLGSTARYQVPASFPKTEVPAVVAGSALAGDALAGDVLAVDVAPTQKTIPAKGTGIVVGKETLQEKTIPRATPASPRLAPHRPFGKYTPSIILVIALVWLVVMLAVGGWFLFSKLRGGGAAATATPGLALPVVAPLLSGTPSLPSSEISAETPGDLGGGDLGGGTAAWTPTAATAISGTLAVDLSATPTLDAQGRTACQIAVQPGENLSIITTKLGTALQIESFTCATGENGGCAYDPAQPDALRDGWVMIFPDVDRGVCQQSGGAPLETVP